jgi:hypothetical protein
VASWTLTSTTPSTTRLAATAATRATAADPRRCSPKPNRCRSRRDATGTAASETKIVRKRQRRLDAINGRSGLPGHHPPVDRRLGRVCSIAPVRCRDKVGDLHD